MQVTVNGIDTHYVLDARSGGPALTFVHQLGGDHTVWDQVAGHFRHRYNVLRYDVRGHGASAVSHEAFGFAQLAADLNAILDTNGVAQTHLIGVSMGGMITQQFAIDYPTRVLSLTLCDTSSRTPHDTRSMWDERAALVRREGTAILADATMERWFTPDFMGDPEVARVRKRLLDDDPKTWSDGWNAISAFSALSRLGAVTVPALVIAGEHDKATSREASTALAAAIPGARLTVLPGAPHMLQIENSAAFVKTVAGFIG